MNAWQTSTTPQSDPKFPLLTSYAFLRSCDDDHIEWLLGNPNVEWLLDSGAFSALNAGVEIKLDEYLDFLDRWGDRLFGYVALDKIGDPKTTDANLKEMIKQGFSPRPVHVRGDDEKRMDELFELSDWVFLGGLRRPHRGHSPRSYVKQKMIWAKGRNVHWLGYTSQKMLFGFKPYSVDSSNAWAVSMYGDVIIYKGNFEWMHNKKFREIKTIPDLGPKIRRAVEHYGFDVSDLYNPSCWRAAGKPIHEFVVAMITVRSFVRYAIDVRRSIGTRVFISTSPERSQVESLFGAIDHYLGSSYGSKEYRW